MGIRIAAAWRGHELPSRTLCLAPGADAVRGCGARCRLIVARGAWMRGTGIAHSVLGEGAGRSLKVSSCTRRQKAAWAADPVADIGAGPGFVGGAKLALGALLALVVAG